MNQVTTFRLYLLRAMYLFIVAGLATYVWPDVIHSPRHWGLAEGEIDCMLAAFSILCALGLRYPLQMLPVLLWEITWKTLWLLLVPLPQWRAGHVDDAIKPGSLRHLHGRARLPGGALALRLHALCQGGGGALASCRNQSPVAPGIK